MTSALLIAWVALVTAPLVGYWLWRHEVPVVGIMAAVPMLLFVLFNRHATVVGDDGVLIRHRVGGQTRVARKDIDEIEDPGRWGTQVRLLRRDGEALVLPYVQPKDIPEIRARLGGM